MGEQAERRDETKNSVDGSDVGGSVIQAGSIVYFIRNGLRKVEVLVGAAVLTALAVLGGLLLPNWLGGGSSSAQGPPSAPGHPVADTDTSAWNCWESAVVPGMKITSQGLRPLEKFPRGGVRASGSSISIVLQGSNDEELILTGARAEIVARHRPVRGLHVVNPCGSEAPQRLFTVDLDRSSASLKAVPDDRPDTGGSPFRGWPYAIKRGDAEYFVVRAQSTKYDTEFRLAVAWRSGDRSGTLRLDDHGKPFRITADTAADQTCIARKGQAIYWLMPAASSTCPEER
ncbi:MULTISPECIES: hypothetical protein [unclassified Streptomyces]|uniref:hypothetical protein n=1 Tax=Streptomyces sp. NPDC059271 TaxID=3346799 RepID=UPI0036BDABA4